MFSKVARKTDDFKTYFIASYNRLQGKYRMGRTVLLQKYKAIYFPIPKVACTSILNMCTELLGIGGQPNLSVHDIYLPGVRDLEGIYSYKAYFKFAFVRNPWDRMVSCYSNKVRQDPSINNQWFKDGIARVS